jgi:hypothetical protein
MTAHREWAEGRPAHDPFAITEAEQVSEIGRATAELLDFEGSIGARELMLAQPGDEVGPVELFFVADVAVFDA